MTESLFHVGPSTEPDGRPPSVGECVDRQTLQAPVKGAPRYRTIVVDPPWPIAAMPAWFREDRRSQKECELGHNPRPYDVMTVGDIKALPIESFADRTAHLYLWTITDHLEASYDVARTWGFEPSCVLVWCKPERPGGLGGTYPANVEFILFATRRVGGDRIVRLTTRLAKRGQEIGIGRKEVDVFMGTSDMGGWWLSSLPHRCACPTNEQWTRLRELLVLDDPDLDDLVAEINATKGEPTARGRANGRWFTWPRAEHSRKPDAFIDLVEQVSPGPYLELFARRQRLGWDTWGHEAFGHVEIAS